MKNTSKINENNKNNNNNCVLFNINYQLMKNGNTLLMESIIYNNNINIILLLLNKEPNIFIKNYVSLKIHCFLIDNI